MCRLPQKPLQNANFQGLWHLDVVLHGIEQFILWSL
jgi:hypothetical protein